MGNSASLFYSSDPEKQTLHRRVAPNARQLELLQSRWQELRDFLESYLSDVTGCDVRTWIQGSYKFGTLIRPVRSSDEFDVDLGIYVVWEGDHDLFSPDDLKGFVQDALIAFKESHDDVTKVADPPKERCCRIHYKQNFHIDVPVYHLDPRTNRRRLATSTRGWEFSDPRAIYIWFRDRASGHDRLRRLIRYLKAWAALTFPQDAGRPSSIMLTVLAAQLYGINAIRNADGDDDALAALLDQLARHFNQSRAVPNPVAPDEDLNRLTDQQFIAFRTALVRAAEGAARGIAANDALTSYAAWSDIFGYLFPGSDALPATATRANLPVAVVTPEISVRVVSTKPAHLVGTYVNFVPPIPKGCDLFFSITNPEAIPVDATVEWVVRNEGDEAEDTNDLGHFASRGSTRSMTATESSAYRGKHYMDCVIRRWGQIIGGRRVPVTIQAHSFPVRNPPRPAFVQHRKGGR